jgi:transitional endoplasmic reticulum ATPase
MKQMYGWAHNVPTPGFFGDNPPTMLSVRVGLNKTVSVPWGILVVPGLEGHLSSGTERGPDGHMRFVIGGNVKRKSEKKVEEITEATREYLLHNSVYKGKAFRLRVTDGRGEPVAMPEPHFLDINTQAKDELVFSRDVEASIAINVFTPIEHRELARQLGVPLKQGILLSGKLGTGKSMTSTVVADKATASGWTFIMCERATEIAEMLRLAQGYAPAVLFCEDIDRVMSGERDIDMDAILNVLDGVESKSSELMVILTTNHVEEISQAMLRPGRLDSIIDVKPPDAEATDRLMRLYGRGLIAQDEDISEACGIVAGQIPAVIQRVVERAKLAAIHRDPSTTWGAGALTGQDLVAAALAMKNQVDLLAERKEDTRSEYVKAAQIHADGRMKAAKVLAGDSNNGRTRHAEEEVAVN